MRKLSEKLGCPILAGGTTYHSNPDPLNERDLWVTRNSAVWFDQQHPGANVYSKRHLVPFSEYVPFKKSWPGLHKLLRKFVPPVMSQLDPGPAEVTFKLTRPDGQWSLAAPICYEGTFARVCRRMAKGADGNRVDLLANLSNDGWFVYRRRGGSYQASSEQAQHLAAYCFRAVENRIPIVRSVNTGISASIDSTGRIVAKLALIMDNYKKYTMVSGTLLLDGAKKDSGRDTYLRGHGPQVLVDSRVSLYSLVGDVFAMCVSAVAVLLAVRLMWRPRKVGNESAPAIEKGMR